jgi:hypothetical protein
MAAPEFHNPCYIDQTYGVAEADRPAQFVAARDEFVDITNRFLDQFRQARDQGQTIQWVGARVYNVEDSARQVRRPQTNPNIQPDYVWAPREGVSLTGGDIYRPLQLSAILPNRFGTTGTHVIEVRGTHPSVPRQAEQIDYTTEWSSLSSHHILRGRAASVQISTLMPGAGADLVPEPTVDAFRVNGDGSDYTSYLGNLSTWQAHTEGLTLGTHAVNELADWFGIHGHAQPAA